MEKVSITSVVRQAWLDAWLYVDGLCAWACDLNSLCLHFLFITVVVQITWGNVCTLSNALTRREWGSIFNSFPFPPFYERYPWLPWTTSCLRDFALYLLDGMVRINNNFSNPIVEKFRWINRKLKPLHKTYIADLLGLCIFFLVTVSAHAHLTES